MTKRWHCEDCGASGAGAFDELHACVLAQPEPAAGADKAIMDSIARRYEGEPLARDMTKREHMRLELTKAALTGLLAGNYKDNTDVRWVKLRAQLYAEELLAALQEKPNAP